MFLGEPLILEALGDLAQLTVRFAFAASRCLTLEPTSVFNRADGKTRRQIGIKVVGGPDVISTEYQSRKWGGREAESASAATHRLLARLERLTGVSIYNRDLQMPDLYLPPTLFTALVDDGREDFPDLAEQYEGDVWAFKTAKNGNRYGKVRSLRAAKALKEAIDNLTDADGRMLAWAEGTDDPDDAKQIRRAIRAGRRVSDALGGALQNAK